jgi:CarD family transcriptional regulator
VPGQKKNDGSRKNVLSYCFYCIFNGVTKMVSAQKSLFGAKRQTLWYKPSRFMKTKQTSHEFKVGDNAVHLSHGVGIVRGIEEREFGQGLKQRFYILEIQDNGAPKKVFVPIGSSGQRLRPIIKMKEVEEVYRILRKRDGSDLDYQTWNRRYREYMEKIHTGKVQEIAEVLRALFLLKHDKELSFGERKLLDQAKTLLVKELSLAQNILEADVERELEAIFGT